MRSISSFIVLALFAAVAFGAETRPAIPLRTPPPITPIEAAGTGLAAEVGVRVEVDEAGRVDKVEITRIEPSTEYDAHYERAARATFLQWRYAPALKNGQPVRAQLEWTVAFAPRPVDADLVGQRKRTASLNLADFTTGFTGGAADETPFQEISGIDARLDFWKQIRSMGVQQRIRLLDQATTAARSLLVGDEQRADGVSFVVRTDSPNAGVAEAVAGNLDLSFSVLYEMFGEDVKLIPAQYKVNAFLYRSQNAFGHLRGRVMGVDMQWAAGFYSPSGLLAFHMEMPSQQALLSLMLHEATHAFIDRHIVREGVLFPVWLNEGLADYVGNSRIKDGQLVPGKVARSDVYQFGMGRSGSQLQLDALKKAAKQQTAPSLAELVHAGDEQFYAGEVSLHYTMAWMLVHYLRHGGEGWAEERFPQLMLYVGEGFPVSEAVQAIYGRAIDSMEPEYWAYVRKL